MAHSRSAARLFETACTRRAVTLESLSARIDDFFGRHNDPRWNLWQGGSVKSNSTRPFLWKAVWGEDWNPEF